MSRKIGLNSKNSQPDILLFNNEIIGGVPVSDVVYLDAKYIDNVPYTLGQKEIKKVIEKEGKATVKRVNGEPITDIEGTEVVPENSNFDINKLEKLTINVNLDLLIL